jgi:thiol-disulfide isomerase/thioredoxin
MKPATVTIATALMSVAVSGCGSMYSSRGGNTSAADSGSASGSSSPERITVTIADRAAYDEVVAKHKGKVVLVDCWATWCAPCMQEFLHTVELSKKSDPTQLAVVSVSMDEPEDEELVLKFLQAQGAAFDNLISTYGVGQKGFESFEITDGAIPHYKVYDRTGALRHSTNSNEDIEQVIEQLLNEG